MILSLTQNGTQKLTVCLKMYLDLAIFLQDLYLKPKINFISNILLFHMKSYF
jgi:hypothetical protein